MATFNLNKPIIDAEGLPMVDGGAVYLLPKEKEIEVLDYNGNKKVISCTKVIEKEPHLTFAKAIRGSLRAAGDSDKDKYDKDECGVLLFKLVADTEVSLTVEEQKLILDASKDYLRTEVNYRIKQLIDSEEEVKEAPKEKVKKK